MKKPQVVYVDAESIDDLKDDDCLSVSATVFRNGGRVDWREAVAFVELTPELLKALREMFSSK